MMALRGYEFFFLSACEFRVFAVTEFRQDSDQ